MKKMHSLNLFSYFNHICLNIEKRIIFRKIMKDKDVSSFLNGDSFHNTKNRIEIKNILKTKLNTNLNFDKELKEIKEEKRRKQILLIKKFGYRIINFFNIKRIVDLKNSQTNVREIFRFLSTHISNYKQALHELVEGHREVTYNKQFKFENGETVKERMEKVTI